MQRPHLRVIGSVTESRREDPGADGVGDVAVYDEGHEIVVLLRGVIDIAAGEELEDVGRYAIDKRMPIVIDVRHVELIDSVGLSFLIRLAAAVRSLEAGVTLCGPAPLVEELLQVAGAAELFVWAEGRPGPDGAPTL